MKRAAFASFAGLALLLASTPAYAVWPFDDGFSSEVETQPLEEKAPAPAIPQPQTAQPVPSPPPPVTSKPKVTPPAKPAVPKAAAPKVEKPKAVRPATPPVVQQPKVETPKPAAPAAEVKPAAPVAAPLKTETPKTAPPPPVKGEAPKATVPAVPVKVEAPKAEPPKTEAPKMAPMITNSGPPKVDMTKPPETKTATATNAAGKAAAQPEKKEKPKPPKEEALPAVQIYSVPKPEEKTADDQKKKESATITGYLQSKPEFATLVSFLQSSGYLAMLKNPGNYTIFAPTDTAFRTLTHPGVEDLKKPENIDLMKSVVSYHILNGNFLLKSAETKKAAPNMLQGEVLEIMGKKAGSANITATENGASNGTIYVIDAVLVPPSLKK
jgi:uncharacterized surface protein with fasciclin (FAS1) repeats